MIGCYRQSLASLRTARRRVCSGARLVVRIGPSLSKRRGNQERSSLQPAQELRFEVGSDENSMGCGTAGAINYGRAGSQQGFVRHPTDDEIQSNSWDRTRRRLQKI
jgi:hypothetical protein